MVEWWSSGVMGSHDFGRAGMWTTVVITTMVYCRGDDFSHGTVEQQITAPLICRSPTAQRMRSPGSVDFLVDDLAEPGLSSGFPLGETGDSACGTKSEL